MGMKQIKVELIDHDISYAAGFLEADGCIHLTNSGVAVRVTNRNLAVLNWFQDKFKGRVREKVIPKNCYEWNVFGEEAIEFLQYVYPFLIFKKPQADILFEFRSTLHTKGKKLPEDTKTKRKQLLTRMKKEKDQWRENKLK